MIPVKNKDNKVDFFLKANSFFRRKISANIREISYYHENNDDSFEVKTLIKEVYQRVYRAKISPTYPEFLAVSDKNNAVLAAVGLRDSGVSELFLEQYLDDGVEHILSKIKGRPIDRSEIIELGSLAAVKKNGGAAHFLYVAISAILRQKGYKYAVVTATEYLQKHFKRAGMRPIIIKDAKKEDLHDQNVDWGSYYKTNPKVMILDVERGYKVLKLFYGISITRSLGKLYPVINYEE